MAEKAGERGEIPVGAVLVCRQTIISRGFNQKEKLQNPTRHAEIIALEAASLKLKSWRLNECRLYVSLEPCLMCAGALIQARIQRLIYAAPDPKAGAVDSLYQTLKDPRLNHRIKTTSGILEKQSSELLKAFFQKRRAKKT